MSGGHGRVLRRSGLGGALALAALSACGEPAAPTGAARSYAGSARCAACHEAAWQAWRPSQHALAERDRDAARAPDAVEAVGPDGVLAAHPVDRAIGVTPLVQYLVPFDGGRWQVLSRSFDPERQEWFDVFGDEDRQPHEWGHWTGRGMNWNSQCADCHNTDLVKGYDPVEDRYHTTHAEMGVGCEACHGPAEAHARWQEEHREASGDPTLPGLQPYARQELLVDACGACHSRRMELTEHFRPGDPLLDSYLPELPGLAGLWYPDGQVLEEDYEYTSFVLSRLYANDVTCSNCHDPHSGRLRHEGNDLCMSCHQETVNERIPPIDPAAHSHHDVNDAGGQCVNCHMPETTYMQRDPRRDHGFTVPDPLLTRELGIPNACNRCHQDQTVDWALTAVEEWYGERMQRPTRRRARAVARVRRGDGDALRGLLDLLQQEDWPAWRAVGAGLLGAYVPDRRAVAALEGLLEDDAALVRAYAARGLELMGATTPPSLRAALDDPVRAVRVTAAWALRRSLDLESPAGQELLEYLHHNADQPVGAMNLGLLWMDRGDLGQAIPWLEKAVQWDPGSPPLFQALAVAYSSARRGREAVEACRRACELAPEDAALWFSLGLALAEQQDPEGAREALARAARLDRAFTRAWYNLGLLEHQLGNGEAAKDALRQATRAGPEDLECWFALATVCRDLQDLGEARFAAQQILLRDPGNRAAAQLLQQLGPAGPEGGPDGGSDQSRLP